MMTTSLSPQLSPAAASGLAPGAAARTESPRRAAPNSPKPSKSGLLAKRSGSTSNLRLLLPPTPATVFNHHVKIHNMITSHARSKFPPWRNRDRAHSAADLTDPVVHPHGGHGDTALDSHPTSPKPRVAAGSMPEVFLHDEERVSREGSEEFAAGDLLGMMRGLVNGPEQLEEMLASMRSALRGPALRCPKAADWDDAELCRFLKGRKGNVERAATQAAQASAIFDEYKMDRILSEDWSKEEANGFLQVLGQDEKGRVVVVLRAGRHFPKSRHANGVTPYEATRYIMYRIAKVKDDYALAQRIVILFDIGNGCSPRKNLDFGFMRVAVPIMQTCFPERLGAVFVFPADPFFWGVWKIVSTFMEEETKAKFNIFGKDYAARLRQYLPAHVVEVEYPSAPRPVTRTMSAPDMRVDSDE